MDLTTVLGDNLQHGKFWTDAWSLVEGCTPVSPGCAHCWLAAMEHRFGRHADRDCLVDIKGVFTGAIRIKEDRLEIPIRARKPRVYAIWSDLFHEGVPEEFRDRVFNRMSAAECHQFIIVTKRPHVAVPFLQRHTGRSDRHFGFQKWPLSNVTILVTMEDQQRADERAPYAMQLTAMGWRVGALCEPLLGPVDITRIYQHGTIDGGGSWGSWESALDGKTPDIWGGGPDIEGGPRLSWVIAGGESGPNARPAHPDWFISLERQAKEAGVPFFFKQWGEWGPWSMDPDKKKEHCEVHPDGRVGGDTYKKGCHVMAKVGKTKAGNVLFNRTCLELPATGLLVYREAAAPVGCTSEGKR